MRNAQRTIVPCKGVPRAFRWHFGGHLQGRSGGIPVAQTTILIRAQPSILKYIRGRLPDGGEEGDENDEEGDMVDVIERNGHIFFRSKKSA